MNKSILEEMLSNTKKKNPGSGSSSMTQSFKGRGID
jgi:hypothetical protein